RALVDLDRAGRALGLQTGPAFSSMLALIEAGPAALDQVRATLEAEDAEHPDAVRVPLDQVRWAPPLVPPRMLCFSVYEQHMKQAFESVLKMKAGRGVTGMLKGLGMIKMPKRFYARPLYYKGNNLSVSAHEGQVLWPRWTEQLDYEMELGVVIGRHGKNVSANDAMDYVFGYTCFNDFSARDKMMQEVPWGGVGPVKGKDFDTGNAMGPWIVTRDEIPDPYDLRMQVRVNGEVRGQSSTSGMTHPISRMIEVATDEERIVPGEFIGTGAAGNGCGIEFLRFLAPGDVVEVEIERIGVLRSTVVRAA
ncbi:MAG: fumarylacetoacetate hydrolase family protein, partial [Pseudomonadota bacterium]|nr:fumarylacetoacetate hydrolase family protein [Pseudomonadota bacterium]